VSVAMLTRCLTQRLFADAPLPALFVDCYARALRELPDALEPVIAMLSSRESVNAKPFLDALGDDIVRFYGAGRQISGDPEIAQLAQVARQLHMTTDVRQSVFYAVTTAADVVDSYTKIEKLGLSKTQRKDVPVVLIECVGRESAYNPFYAALVVHFVGIEKRFRKNLVVALRNAMKLLQGTDVRQIRNTGMFCAEAIEKGGLGIGFLKGAQLMQLGAPATLFVNITLREVFARCEAEEVLREMRGMGRVPGFAADLRKFIEKRLSPFMKGQSSTPRHAQALLGRAVEAISESLAH